MFVKLAALIAVPAVVAFAAAPKAHDVDKSHSEINFIAESRFLTAHGFFGRWDAEVAYDAEAPANSTVKVTIDATSINTRNDRRDNHLRSADFFDVANHPTITFVSKKVAAPAPDRLDVTGDLTIRGTTKEVTIPFRTVYYENGRGRFKGEFTIDRMEYGVSYNGRANPIEPEVKVQIEMAIMEKKTQ